MPGVPLPAVRLLDLDVPGIPHCSMGTRVTTQDSIWVTKRQLSRKGDLNTPHPLVCPCPPCCCPHAAPLISFSHVIASKMPAGVNTHYIFGCGFAANGAMTVLMGKT
jgi:hypothetical protein